MPASIILRFDDITPTMRWETWEKVESLLNELAIKPIVAVVPDNQDPLLDVSPPAPDFWARVKRWQKDGWVVALHGYQHVYVNENPGLIRMNKRSEFAGLPYAEQLEKLEAAVALFRRHDIVLDTWVAPSHSFDENTLLCLGKLGLNIVSDGLFRRVVERKGQYWVPAQVWDFNVPDDGVWTICFHTNNWSEADFERFSHSVRRMRDRIVTLEKVLTSGHIPPFGLREVLESYAFRLSFAQRRIRAELGRILRSK